MTPSCPQQDCFKAAWTRATIALSWLFLLVSFAHAGMAGLILFKGGTWARMIYASQPLWHILGAAAFFLGWYLIRYGPRLTARDWKRLAGNIVLLALSLAFSAVAGEIGLRAYLAAKQGANSMERLTALQRDGRPLPVRSTHPLAMIIQPSTNIQVVYELQPRLDVDFGHVRVRTNKRGMRQDRDCPVPRFSNSVRVVGIGDSGMFGWSVEQGESYMSVLESNLNARSDGTRYETLNLAVPGYNTQLEVESLQDKGLVYKPDVVIVGWCDNDFGLPYFLLEKQNLKRRDVSFLYCLLFDRARFQEIAYMKFSDRREFNKEQLLPDLVSGTDIEGVRRALYKLKALGASHGFKVLVFGPMCSDALSVCKAVDIPYYNTNEKIPEGRYPEDYLIHFMHPRAEGHRVLAQYLEQELVTRGWLPAAAQATPAPVAVHDAAAP